MSWTMRELLLHGHPSEIIPGQRPLLVKAARRYSRDPRLSRLDRERIARVWLGTQADEEPDEPLLLFDSPDSGGDGRE